MSKLNSKRWLSTTTLIGLGVLAATSSWAATSGAGSAKARYQQQTEQCRNIGDHDRRANCLSEASTAYAQTQPTSPQEDPMLLAQNALRRCDRLPGPDRTDCVARINGAGTIEGSVAGGGVLRTLVTREAPVAQANPPGMPAPSQAVPSPLPPPGPTPGAQPSPPPIQPPPADVPLAPPQPPRAPGSPN